MEDTVAVGGGSIMAKSLFKKVTLLFYEGERSGVFAFQS